MIPNIITIIRILLIFPLTYSILTDAFSPIINATLLLIIVMSDYLDGHIARKYNMVTDFGKVVDPIADKSVFLFTTIALLITKKMPLYTLFIFARDILVTGFAIYIMKKRKKAIASDIYGKTKTVLHFFAILITLYLNKWNPVSLILLILAFLTIIPECIYGYREYLKK